jgi:hypothetical protein
MEMKDLDAAWDHFWNCSTKRISDKFPACNGQQVDAEKTLEVDGERIGRFEICRGIEVDPIDDLDTVVIDIFRFARSHGRAKINAPSAQAERPGIKKIGRSAFF